MVVLVKILQGVKMDVLIKENQEESLESKLPIDRVVTVLNGITSLADEQFYISEDMIERIIDGDTK